MSWGNRLILVFVAFAALIGTLVYKSYHTRFDLVSEDYYRQELSYQQKIDGMKNAGKIGGLEVTQDKELVTITLPPSLKGLPVKGEAWFYRKNNAGGDRKIPLRVNSDGQQVFSKSQLLAGAYVLKVDWITNGNNYYVEKELQVN